MRMEEFTSRQWTGASGLLSLAGAPCRLLLVLLATLPAARLAAQEIPSTRFKLENGLTVILNEDHRLPLVAINLWYYVGSKDEPPRRSGFAHLFEHLMFMGTEKFPYPQFDNIMEKAGASNNASTSVDRTNYFESGPSEFLDTFLELEADRMASLDDAMTQEKLDTQREVVRNERRQRYENRPYGKVQLEVPLRLYPKGHPYHEPVIGSHEDLESASVDDVKEFFQRFYFPANASLVLAGDFDPAQARELVRKHFGPPAARPPVERQNPPPLELEGTIRASVTDAVELPMSAFIWHSPAIFKPGDADMDIVASALGEGKSSRLYRRLVYEKKLAQEVSVRQTSKHLTSEFWIGAKARPGASLDELEAEIDKELDRLREEGPTQREVDRARNKIEASFWRGVEGLGERAELLNLYQFHFGDPGAITRDRGRYAGVTPETAREWARKVLKEDARLILRVLPEHPPEEKK